MPKYGRVVIVGVGLLGGSIGKTLRAAELAKEVVGVGRSEEKLRRAVELGVIDNFQLDLQSACEGASVVVVCTPVLNIAEQVISCCQWAPSDAMVTDVGSTKAQICRTVAQRVGKPESAQFCGSHPLAGSDRSGAEFADANLLVGKLTLVTPTEETRPEIVKRVEEFWQGLGSRTQRMVPEEHDRAIARTSHLPHLLASALAFATPEDLLPLAASGWRDTTRIAAGDAELWRQIVAENRDSILDSMREFSTQWHKWIEVLEAGEFDELAKLLDAGKRRRESLGN